MSHRLSNPLLPVRFKAAAWGRERAPWTVGVLVQSNFGGVLTIKGVEIGCLLGRYPYREQVEKDPGGSIIIVVATDAPLSHRNLQRLASRAFLGVARTGGYASNGSGDYAIAFSTHPGCRYSNADKPVTERPDLDNNSISPLFLAVVEATEEAIIDSLFTANTTIRRQGGGSAPRRACARADGPEKQVILENNRSALIPGDRSALVENSEKPGAAGRSLAQYGI